MARQVSERKVGTPFFVTIMAVGSAAMLVPAIHAWSRSDFATGRIFLYGAIIGLVVSGLIALATQGRKPANPARSQLLTLVAAFTVMPAIFAMPLYEAVWNTSFLNAWFEMVSSFTTTGATVYDNFGRLNSSLHLWRATVGWLGGLLVWIMAVAILAPMKIGGFEVRSAILDPGDGLRHSQFGKKLDLSERLSRYGRQLVPIYVGLTAMLWLGLLVAGERPFVAICHAMSVIATSGISPIGGVEYSRTGFSGEILIFVFFVFGISRLTFSSGLFADDSRKLWRDPEFQMAAALVLIVPTLLMLRHFVAAAETSGDMPIEMVFHAAWGALFTVLSFLTTTGFESADWMGAQDWSGLETPGLILVGLALVGGGVATTAGGVKLLRVYALFKHGERELGRLVYPNSVGGSGGEARRIRRQGAYISWIFFMLFALSVAGIMLLLTMTGVQFETSMVLAVSALSTTGPLAVVAAETPISYSGIPDTAKMILAFAMVLGRLETLAILALFNPDFWRS
ncbi:TrkH family potassium uptake protein [Flavimaricola marinus]|nr:potassium transporter TrkG [Flavimaricola marinus]